MKANEPSAMGPTADCPVVAGKMDKLPSGSPIHGGGSGDPRHIKIACALSAFVWNSET